MTNLEQIRKELSPVRRKKVEARNVKLIAEEMTLQELRRAHKLTQVRMAKKLGVSQGGISKLEKRGGSLSLVAEFPDRSPIVVSGIAEDGPRAQARNRVHPRA